MNRYCSVVSFAEIRVVPMVIRRWLLLDAVATVLPNCSALNYCRLHNLYFHPHDVRLRHHCYEVSGDRALYSAHVTNDATHKNERKYVIFIHLFH